MKYRILIFVISAFLMVSACQAAPEPTAVEPQTKSASQENMPSKLDLSAISFRDIPDAVGISVALDQANSTEAVIPVEGGSISATGADGTRYDLEIPADALSNETRIKITPVSSVSDMPFGGELSNAVHLEPEGLFFNNFAILTITPAQEIPIDQQIFFGYEGDGQNLVFAPPVVDAREIKIQILHFSGYGVTKGFLADTEPVRQRLGGDAEARIQSQVAEYLSRERQRQLLGQNDSGAEPLDFEDYFRQYEEQVVKPRVAAAGESCAAGRLALQTVLGLERQRQLLGYGDGGKLLQPGNGGLDENRGSSLRTRGI